jgi:hypothetical protein
VAAITKPTAMLAWHLAVEYQISQKENVRNNKLINQLNFQYHE